MDKPDGPYKLTYFAIPALAEPIRLLLTMGQFDWIDEKVTAEEWKSSSKKEQSKWGQLPYLTLPDGRVFCQSQAIVRFVAKQVYIAGKKLYPDDPVEAMAVDEMIFVFEDMRMKLIPTFSMTNSEVMPKRKELVTPGGAIFEILVNIENNFITPFLCGSECSLADVWAFWFLRFMMSGFWEGIPQNMFGPFPKLASLSKKVGAYPSVRAYYAGRQGLYSSFAAVS